MDRRSQPWTGEISGLEAIAACAAERGLAVRGAFHPRPEDGVPALAGGDATGTLVLLGNAGPGMWPHFAASPEAGDGRPDPLDRWSRRVIEALARELGARALYPFGGPPHLPFQRWARRAGPLFPSPIGPLIDPRYGLWHGYRGALAFAERLALPDLPPADNPCRSCADRPCLHACPVGAFADRRYDVGACAAHLRAAAGDECRGRGCLARRACPVAADQAYGEAQQRFHMRAFLAAR